jgi:hypothetical protein
MKNPWLSLWMSAANTATGTVRGFWTAEMHRQQKAMMKEVARSSDLGRAQPAPKKRRTSKRTKAGR